MVKTHKKHIISIVVIVVLLAIIVFTGIKGDKCNDDCKYEKVFSERFADVQGCYLIRGEDLRNMCLAQANLMNVNAVAIRAEDITLCDLLEYDELIDSCINNFNTVNRTQPEKFIYLEFNEES